MPDLKGKTMDIITEQQPMDYQSALFNNQHEYPLILIWRSDETLDCNWFNDPWLEFTGKKVNEVLAEGWNSNIHPDDLFAYQQLFRTGTSKREIFTIEYRLRHHTGQYRWVLEYSAPYHTTCGNFGGYTGCSIDIHDKKLLSSTITEWNIAKQQALIQVCSYCKKIKIPYSSWEVHEEYLTIIQAKSISHGICPECFKIQMRQFDEMDRDTIG